MGPGPDWAARPADETDLDARRPARIDAALQAGWAIRFDWTRLEYTATRELQVARTLDELLEKIEDA